MMVKHQILRNPATANPAGPIYFWLNALIQQNFANSKLLEEYYEEIVSSSTMIKCGYGSKISKPSHYSTHCLVFRIQKSQLVDRPVDVPHGKWHRITTCEEVP